MKHSPVRSARPHRVCSALLGASLALLATGTALAALPAPGISPQIVGGADATDGQYPFLLSLQYGDQHICGASLIAPDRVLTAAHCVEGAKPGEFTVLAGQTVLSGSTGTRHRLTRIHIHPDYANTRKSDVAVLELATPVAGITPVRLVGPEGATFERPGRLLTVAGWGRLTEGGEAADRLQHVAVPFIAHAQCQKQYDGRFQVNRDRELCASRPGKDSCQGDSGGPLFVQGADAAWIQLGVVSWGFGCARKGSPGVYARLASPALFDFVQTLAD